MKTLYDYCIENRKTYLLDEWDEKQNLPYTVKTIAYASHKIVWWRCSEGHSFSTALCDRTLTKCGCPYCSGKRPIVGKNDFKTLYPEHAKLWHKEKNGKIGPENVLPFSNKKFWWQCEKGHEWQQVLETRRRGNPECPVCAGTVLVSGINDLATVCPEVAKEWHPTKNGTFTPNQVLPGSHKNVWWICENGHEWEQEVRVRVENGCPVCKNQVMLTGYNDLLSSLPEIAKEWHPTKNGALTPDMVHAGSNEYVWWKCEHGHEWRSKVRNRTRGLISGCPYCAHKKVIVGETDLKTVFPDIAEDWNYEKNGNLKPENVTAYSNKKVWWKCELGHEWESDVSSRTIRPSHCPYCSGHRVLPGFNDLATVYPKIAAEWHPTKNGDLTPNMVTKGSGKKVWWQCSEGHEWKTTVASRTGPKKCGCRQCWYGFARTGRSKRKKITKKFDGI